MSIYRRLFRAFLWISAFLAVVGAVAGIGIYAYVVPELPSTESLKDVRFQVPLRVFTDDGRLMAEFGEMKRAPIRYEDVPPLMIKAIISAEDDRFFDHPGVDYQGLVRASVMLLLTGEKSQGGSTITMQVARNFFLTREKTYLRKLTEILLALKIEHELTKEEILALYLNKIYFGNRAYGIVSAAQVYYGIPLDQLTVAQMAMLAGLPKAPSRDNPVADPEKAMHRRNYVLGRMHSLAFIDDQTYEMARAAPVTAKLYTQPIEVEASYVAEMVRQEMVNRYGDDAYTSGFNVYTTLESDKQQSAVGALRRALLEYDQRHGYRGPIDHVDVAPDSTVEQWDELLRRHPKVGPLQPALVTAADETSLSVYVGEGASAVVPFEGLQWARPYVSENQVGPAVKRADQVAQIGDIVMCELDANQTARLSQIPQVAGALVALNPNDGAIRALVGGFDYYQSKYNRITQALRQPGSSFKPFVYSAALEKGYTPASIINDAPVVFEDPALESSWRPENYSGRFFGPTRLREALVNSRNLVSIRLLQSIGIIHAVNYAGKFGFNIEKLPRNLSLALGSGAVTPLELARAHAVFANGGYLVSPYFIRRIEDALGTELFKANPEIVCPKCEEEQARAQAQIDAEPIEPEETPDDPATAAAAPATAIDPGQPAPQPLAKRVISEQNAYLINSMMRDVTRRGTGRRVAQLGRTDLAGKTGTTNDQHDAWFVGFNTELLAVSWLGFDEPLPLGAGETGSRAALPIWLYFMANALKDEPEHLLDRPTGLVTVRIDPETGELARTGQEDAIFETFPADNAPTTSTRSPDDQRPPGDSRSPTTSRPPEAQLF